MYIRFVCLDLRASGACKKGSCAVAHVKHARLFSVSPEYCSSHDMRLLALWKRACFGLCVRLLLGVHMRACACLSCMVPETSNKLNPSYHTA